jgi:hypothetical protein
MKRQKEGKEKKRDKEKRSRAKRRDSFLLTLLLRSIPFGETVTQKDFELLKGKTVVGEYGRGASLYGIAETAALSTAAFWNGLMTVAFNAGRRNVRAKQWYVLSLSLSFSLRI